ncbi:hypothetical protein ABEB36_015152 [Hypothenemus hampei]|uniref:DUF4371 domain-containing protein n=1 Tax=Hypothenemus hampei TaxID=57062 RepID=A0ABD1E0U2_HYPHA
MKKSRWRPKLIVKNLITQFDWLDENKEIPFCKLCNTKITGGVFHLNRHTKREMHQKLYISSKRTPQIKNFLAANNSMEYMLKRAELKMACYEKTTQLIKEVLAPFFQKQILEDLKTTNFTLIVDETTDIATQKSLIIVVKYFKEGKIIERVLDLIRVKEGTANALFITIKNLLLESAIPFNNIVSFAADNANTMMGEKMGFRQSSRK